MEEKREINVKEKVIQLVEVLSDDVVRKILIFTQGLIAGQNIANSTQKKESA